MDALEKNKIYRKTNPFHMGCVFFKCSKSLHCPPLSIPFLNTEKQMDSRFYDRLQGQCGDKADKDLSSVGLTLS